MELIVAAVGRLPMVKFNGGGRVGATHKPFFVQRGIKVGSIADVDWSHVSR